MNQSQPKYMPMAGPQTKQPPQQAPQSYSPWMVDSYNNYQGQEAQARYGAQAQKDMAAFGAAQNLGIAGQNAMGQYGAAQANALTNSQIAQANALGQLGTSYYNTMGQFGQANAGMTAAASQAGADSNKAAALSGLAGGMMNAQMYGASMAPYTAGNMPNFNFGGFGGGGGGGFRATGPEGTLASGTMSNDQGFGPPRTQGRPDGRQFNPPPAPPYMSGGGMQGFNPYEPFRQGSQNMMRMVGAMGNKDAMPNLARQDMNNAFQTTQKNLMHPGIKDSLNSQMAMGYGALGGLYGQSNYGFNTSKHPFTPRYSGAKFSY